MAKGLNTARVRTTINTDILERIVGRKQDIPDMNPDTPIQHHSIRILGVRTCVGCIGSYHPSQIYSEVARRRLLQHD